MKSNHIAVPAAVIETFSRSQAAFAEEILAAGYWLVQIRRVKFPHDVEIDYIRNLVTTAGLNKYLDATLKTGLATPAWYVGLTDGTPTVDATDVMSSHVGWVEVTAYDEATRQAWTPGTIAAGSIDNSASQATITVDTNSTTIGGAFLVDNSTKGGTTGTLLMAGVFTAGDKSLDDNDTLDITATLTQSAS